MSAQPAVGYSGTPLARKLGIKEGMVIAVSGAPDRYLQLLGPLPKSVEVASRISSKANLVHLFASTRSSLEKQLLRLREVLAPDAAIWVSWPKRASRMPTDITEDVIRALALPLGLVDVKVCAVDEVWSGLKLVVRKHLRKSSALAPENA